ncbi:MAG: spore cortex biosynthesis protein YabQ [Lachnospiraceae bacterium]|nr:spore cortex biosynthesis protein YabQ [Lachnospiraceae bacterium]
MTELIRTELFQSFIMFYCGLSIMILFEGRDGLIRRCGNRKRLAGFIYFLGWICAAFLFYRFLYRASHGALTVCGLAAMGAGIFLWKKIICGILKEKI